MRPARQLFVVLAVLSLCVPVYAKSKHLIVTGKLTELATSDTQSTSWALRLNPVIIVDGHQLSIIEIKTRQPQKLEPLEDEFVQAKGILLNLDSADRPVLQLSSIHSVKYNNPGEDKPKFSLWSSIVDFFAPNPI